MGASTRSELSSPNDHEHDVEKATMTASLAHVTTAKVPVLSADAVDTAAALTAGSDPGTALAPDAAARLRCVLACCLRSPASLLFLPPCPPRWAFVAPILTCMSWRRFWQAEDRLAFDAFDVPCVALLASARLSFPSLPFFPRQRCPS